MKGNDLKINYCVAISLFFSSYAQATKHISLALIGWNVIVFKDAILSETSDYWPYVIGFQ